jgi:hypothetical protein
MSGYSAPAAACRALCHSTATRPPVRWSAGPMGCQVPSKADWAAVGPQPRGGAGVTALLTAYRGQSGGAGRMAMLAAPRAQTLQVHECSLLLRIGAVVQVVIACAAVGAHDAAGVGPSP